MTECLRGTEYVSLPAREWRDIFRRARARDPPSRRALPFNGEIEKHAPLISKKIGVSRSELFHSRIRFPS